MVKGLAYSSYSAAVSSSPWLIECFETLETFKNSMWSRKADPENCYEGILPPEVP